MKHPRPSCPTHRCPEHYDQREILLEAATPAFLRRLADQIERQQEEAEQQRRLTGNRGTDAEKRKLLKAVLLFHGLMGGLLLIAFGFVRLVLCSLMAVIAFSFL